MTDGLGSNFIPRRENWRSKGDGVGWVEGGLQAAIVIVAAFEPVVARAGVAEEELANAFEVLDAVFDGDDQTEGGAMANG